MFIIKQLSDISLKEQVRETYWSLLLSAYSKEELFFSITNLEKI
jgi:hypothetical protein